MCRANFMVCKKPVPSKGSHLKVNVNLTKGAKCLLLGTTRDRMPSFVILISHGFTFVIWAEICLTSEIWPFVGQFFCSLYVNQNLVASHTCPTITVHISPAFPTSPWVETHVDQEMAPIRAFSWSSAVNSSMDINLSGSAGSSVRSILSSSHFCFLILLYQAHTDWLPSLKPWQKSSPQLSLRISHMSAKHTTCYWTTNLEDD